MNNQIEQLLSLVYIENQRKSIKIKESMKRYQDWVIKQLRTPHNACDLSVTPNQQNKMSIDLDMQIHGSKKTPSEYKMRK